MSAHLNPLEKETLIKRYMSNPDANLNDFCYINHVSVTAFKKWMAKYNEEGLEGLIGKRKDELFQVIVPEGTDPSTENLKREILKLRIENERLKKSYAVETTPDGASVFKPLKKTNSKSSKHSQKTSDMM